MVIVLIVPLYAVKERISRAGRDTSGTETASFVGREKCVNCHENATNAWKGSDHDNAMAVASDSTVVGDFNNVLFAQGDVTARFYKKDGRFFVHTQGPEGVPGDFHSLAANWP